MKNKADRCVYVDKYVEKSSFRGKNDRVSIKSIEKCGLLFVDNEKWYWIGQFSVDKNYVNTRPEDRAEIFILNKKQVFFKEKKIYKLYDKTEGWTYRQSSRENRTTQSKLSLAQIRTGPAEKD